MPVPSALPDSLTCYSALPQNELSFHPVTHVDEVLEAAFDGPFDRSSQIKIKAVSKPTSMSSKL